MRESGILEKRDSNKAEYHKRRIAEAVMHHQVNSFRDEVRRETTNRREELTSYYAARIQSTGSQLAVHTPESIREAQSIIEESKCEDFTGVNTNTNKNIPSDPNIVDTGYKT